ncbi:hypothetical protein KPL71_017611 [Citrus sinensis]|uniref:Uncharacterized protein n=1 Tax=Citrus sinensis TaxID=2711 RepID=A0ACB8JRA5_CITSI|nr:hypothetical protein KPL71_017611 [Citrus sinensis]
MITLLAVVKTLISFSPLRSSLFSFKSFFSSPLIFSSKLPFHSLSLSFDRPDSTFQSLQSLLLNPALNHNFSKASSFLPQGLNVVAPIRQLVHDHAWDSVICYDSVNNGKILDESAGIKSSLVVLFSPIIESMKFLSKFLDVNVSDECLTNVGSFKTVYRCEEAVKFYGMLVDPILDPESTVIKLKEVYFAKECNSS